MLRTLILTALLASPAAAFTQDDVLAATLLPGWRTADGTHIAALSLTLAPGWKTYWRSPGEAGIPPVLDFEGSSNFGTARLHWPSPVVFDVNGLQTIGYHDRLILPIEVKPQQPGQPIEMQLNVDLGVCRDICLPAHLSLTATLPAEGKPDPLIRAALASRPHKARDAGLTAIHCAASPISDGLTISTTITMPALGGREAVILEPADGAIWVSQSDTTRSGATLTSVTDLVPPNGAPFALDRSTLRVTVVSEQGAVEVTGCPAP
ncbi:MAG: protein-disulfide reductase DsbD domain-containing protein [Paracoccaceae bacterium]